MSNFIVLGNFTDKGFSEIKDIANTFNQWKEIAIGHGAKINWLSILIGQYDFILLLEAPSIEILTGVILSFDRLGKIHTVTLPSLNENDIVKIISKI